MPSAPLRPCRHPGCRATVRGGGYCAAHPRTEYVRQMRTRADQAKGPERQFYSTPAWRAVRAQRLALDPYCCCGCGRRANTVDHIKSRRLFPELALELSNTRSYYANCHNRKTATFDGGFGNAQKVR